APISAELYNGWTVELSTNPMYDIHKRSIETGIAPYQPVLLNTKDGKSDNIIEQAKVWIMQDQ
ncbi:MAG: peptidase S41, partial [Bacteroidales bacterium]|nr:peptidase S41 [Bacteroidales bacterium]